MSKTAAGRLAYADLLRVVACMAVIILHCCGGWLTDSPVGSANWNILNIYDGLVRWCVPMFIMLSGMFMLDPKKPVSIPSIFYKYILRLLVALVVWGGIYALFDNWPGWRGISWDWFVSTAKSVLMGNTHYHLWFLPMMMGLYLLTPVLRAFVRGASRADLHYFFLLSFLVTYLLPTLLKLWPNAAVSHWLSELNLYALAGYTAYYVAGYYLKTYTIGRVAEFVIYGLGIGGGVVTVMGTLWLSRAQGSLNGVFYSYLAPNVAAMAVAIFVLFRYVLGVSDERSRRQRLGGVAKVTFGMYLVHDFFIALLGRLGLARPALTPALAVPLLAVVIFLCSFAVAWLISKIPFVGKYLT